MYSETPRKMAAIVMVKDSLKEKFTPVESQYTGVIAW